MPKATKKELAKQVEEKLSTIFPDLKDNLGSRKFIKNVKKARKNLLAGIRQIPLKKDTAQTAVAAGKVTSA